MSSRAVKPITNQPTVDLDPFTGVKINHCSIICMTNALMTDTVTFIYLHAGLF